MIFPIGTKILYYDGPINKYILDITEINGEEIYYDIVNVKTGSRQSTSRPWQEFLEVEIDNCWVVLNNANDILKDMIK